MRNALIFTFILAFAFLLISCCNEHDDNSGAIISDLRIGDYWQEYECLNLPDTLCIRDDSTYLRAFNIDSLKSNCKELILPSIDFDKNSILIYQIKEGGRIFFHRSVLIDSLNKEITYSISTTGCFCPDKCENANHNIVVVPKIGKDYKVKYK